MRCGILIIGSLLWDAETVGRTEWRDSRLDLTALAPVRAPIQYGRKSSSRGNSYTMTFHTGHPSGRGSLVPCTAAINTIDDLVAEAQALWRVEAPTSQDGELHKSWGCVGALFRRKELCPGLSDDWTDHFKTARVQRTSVIDTNGLLDIRWPETADGRPVDFDAILATATKPAAEPPTAHDIAKAWLDQDDGNESYFFNNVKHGIRTSNDLAIWGHFEKAAPAWLADESHADAVNVLRAELSAAAIS